MIEAGRNGIASETDFSITGSAPLVENVPQGPRVSRRKFTAKVSQFLSMDASGQRNAVVDPARPPWNAVTLLNLFRHGAYQGFATGFYMKPDLVLTAAHTFKVADPDSIGVYPGFDARKNPTANARALAWAWDGARDLAVIVTGQHATGFMEFAASLPPSVQLAGYAFPYIDDGPRLTGGTGACKPIGNQLHYDIVVREGDSGAPVFHADPTGRCMSLAVHTESRLSPGQTLFGIGEYADAELKQLVDGLEDLARSNVAGRRP